MTPVGLDQPCLPTAPPAQRHGMDTAVSSAFIHLTSPFLSMVFARDTAMIAQFGVESGGRLRRHIEGNVLKPGLGMTAGKRRPATVEHAPGRLVYRCRDGLDWDVAFPDDRTLHPSATCSNQTR